MGGGTFGKMGQSCWQEPLMDPGQEHRGVQAIIGDVVAVGVGDLLDKAVGAQAS
jgi:hypothetical protein